MPNITTQATGYVEVEILDAATGRSINTFTVESRDMAERYVRSQIALHEQLIANLPVNARAAFPTYEYLIDGDEFDGEATL